MIKSFIRTFYKNSTLSSFSRQSVRFFSKEKTETKLKHDPHEQEIYKKVLPSLGKPPAPEPIPPFVANIMEPRKGDYHITDAPNSLAFALRRNFPILRESVSAMYRVHINGITYHVFNGARVPLGRILAYSTYYLQGKNSPLYEPNKYECFDKIVIVNAKNIMLSGKKLKYKMYYKPSTRPGHLKSWTAKELILKDPKLLIMKSLRGMIPKNDLRDKYMQNVIVFDGPAHNLHNLGLPQFANVKPINFNEMFGTDVNPKTNKVVVAIDCPKEEIEKFKSQGYEVIVDEKKHLRDFWRKDEYNRFNRKHLRSFTKKIIDKRIKDFKKVKYKGIRYI